VSPFLQVEKRVEQQQHNKQHEGMERESNFYFQKLRNIEVLLQSAKQEKYFKGKVKTLFEEIFHILNDKNDNADVSQCADCQLEQDIQEARENLEEETDLWKLFLLKARFWMLKQM